MVPQITNFSQIGKSSIFSPSKSAERVGVEVTMLDKVKIGSLPAHYGIAAREKGSLNQKGCVKLEQRYIARMKRETSIGYMETVMHCAKRNWNVHAREP